VVVLLLDTVLAAVLNETPLAAFAALAAWLALFFTEWGGVLLQDFVSGRREPQAIAVLGAGILIALFMGRRLVRLNEDMVAYRVRTWWDWEWSRKTGRAWPNEGWRFLPGLSDWIRERQALRLTRLAQQASASRWSRVCRWQAGVLTLRQVLPVIVMGTFLSFGWARDIDRPEAQRLLIFLPGLLAIGVAYRRPVSMSAQLCLPVARREFLKQLGVATAVSCLEMWLIAVAPLLLSYAFAGPRAQLADIGRVLALSLLNLVWYFGMVVWFGRFRSPRSLLPLGALGLALALAMLAFLYFGQMTQSRSFQVSGAVAVATIGALLAIDAYRRWLVTDLE